MKPYTLVGLDIGTHSVKMAVMQRKEEEGDLEILGFGEELSSGVRKGAIVDPDKVAKNILALKGRIENISGQKIKEVVVNLGGNHIFTVPSHGIVAVSRADGQISQEDVDRVLQAAQAFSLPWNKEILEVFPQAFLVDGEEQVKEVSGMRGVRLEADVLALCGFRPYIKNLEDAVLGAGLEIADIVASPLMSVSTVTTQRERELGIAVLDIGAGTCDLAVYEEGDLVHAAVFPIGSENITNDIGVGLRTEPYIAERVKMEFGTCQGSKGKRIEKMELDEGDQFSFSPKMLSHIIDSRVKEVFQLVNKELKSISRQGALPGGIVLVGGGAKLPKITDLAKRDLKITAKMGSPKGVVSLNSDPAFLGVIGLLVGQASTNYHLGGKKNIGFGILPRIKKLFKPFIP
jgi:cell division protein FtsA